MSTVYHAKYFANELTRLGGSGIDRLSRSLFDACVDLNPHQIDAALFAFRSPLSKGVLLADEVGLGKTIEAGLVLCQFWAERRRRLLVICPASIRKQWAIELFEKFSLPTVILDAREYRSRQVNGYENPFQCNEIVITSLHYASQKAAEIRSVPWDLVVIDEAHKLRNAYRQSNRMGQNIRFAIEGRKKILLTATPLQNSLLELFGLSTLIDENIFADVTSFRNQFAINNGNLEELQNRLRNFCHRTLRRQVVEYIQYTNRRLITQSFIPTDQEQTFYEDVSGFLQRQDTYSIPYRQRHLITIILRKLLASSPRAVAATLKSMCSTLEAIRDNANGQDAVEGNNFAEMLIEAAELEDDLLDELVETAALSEDSEDHELMLQTGNNVSNKPEIDIEKINQEIDLLNLFVNRAQAIGIDTKSRALISALEIGFQRMAEMGALRRAVIFTESRRTQEYLKEFLEANNYQGRVLNFNGSNNDPDTVRIYERWVEANLNSGRVTGSRAVDIRTALIEHFRDHGEIMIATEAGAEGLNLQFCSLVINYDLPWNPQRIEQRIGRCHRYGQRHDVVVINFLNERNAADRRVYELLEEKFTLFSGVFGASDEVLGTIESGVDFEKRVNEIYRQCRTPQEIEEAFLALRKELEEKIDARMKETRQQILENFDEDVHSRLRVNLDGARERLDYVGILFWRLTHFILQGKAEFDNANFSFDLETPPCEGVRPGHYRMISKDQQVQPGSFLYRLSHPLGEYVIEAGKNTVVPLAHVKFDITNRPTRLALVEALKGSSGWLCLQRLVINTFEREEFLLFSGIDDNGRSLDQETIEKMFNCDAVAEPVDSIPAAVEERLAAEAGRHANATIARSMETNSLHFREEREKLEKWADDMVLAAEKELRDTKERIKALTRQARLATTTEEQHALQNQIRKLEKQKRRQRQRIFEYEDEIMERRDRLIEKLEKQMVQETRIEPLFTIRWTVV